MTATIIILLCLLTIVISLLMWSLKQNEKDNQSSADEWNDLTLKNLKLQSENLKLQKLFEEPETESYFDWYKNKYNENAHNTEFFEDFWAEKCSHEYLA